MSSDVTSDDQGLICSVLGPTLTESLMSTIAFELIVDKRPEDACGWQLQLGLILTIHGKKLSSLIFQATSKDPN